MVTREHVCIKECYSSHSAFLYLTQWVVRSSAVSNLPNGVVLVAPPYCSCVGRLQMFEVPAGSRVSSEVYAVRPQ